VVVLPSCPDFDEADETAAVVDALCGGGVAFDEFAADVGGTVVGSAAGAGAGAAAAVGSAAAAAWGNSDSPQVVEIALHSSTVHAAAVAVVVAAAGTAGDEGALDLIDLLPPPYY